MDGYGVGIMEYRGWLWDLNGAGGCIRHHIRLASEADVMRTF